MRRMIVPPWLCLAVALARTGKAFTEKLSHNRNSAVLAVRWGLYAEATAVLAIRSNRPPASARGRHKQRAHARSDIRRGVWTLRTAARSRRRAERSCRSGRYGSPTRRRHWCRLQRSSDRGVRTVLPRSRVERRADGTTKAWPPAVVVFASIWERSILSPATRLKSVMVSRVAVQPGCGSRTTARSGPRPPAGQACPDRSSRSGHWRRQCR